MTDPTPVKPRKALTACGGTWVESKHADSTEKTTPLYAPDVPFWTGTVGASSGDRACVRVALPGTSTVTRQSARNSRRR